MLNGLLLRHKMKLRKVRHTKFDTCFIIINYDVKQEIVHELDFYNINDTVENISEHFLDMDDISEVFHLYIYSFVCCDFLRGLKSINSCNTRIECYQCSLSLDIFCKRIQCFFSFLLVMFQKVIYLCRKIYLPFQKIRNNTEIAYHLRQYTVETFSVLFFLLDI